MEGLAGFLDFDEETQLNFQEYLKEHSSSEDSAIKHLTAIGLSYYYADKTITELEAKEDFSIKLRQELMAVSAKYASLKFNYFEMKMDYDRLKLQVSGLIHENRQYQVSLQHADNMLRDYNKELKTYKEKTNP